MRLVIRPHRPRIYYVFTWRSAAVLSVVMLLALIFTFRWQYAPTAAVHGVTYWLPVTLIFTLVAFPGLLVARWFYGAVRWMDRYEQWSGRQLTNRST